MVDNKIDQLYEHYNKLVGANPDQIKEVIFDDRDFSVILFPLFFFILV